MDEAGAGREAVEGGTGGEEEEEGDEEGMFGEGGRGLGGCWRWWCEEEVFRKGI